MAWTAPRTWTTGETVSASQLNTHVRDNLLELRAARACRAKQTSTQNISDVTWTAITLNAEDYDTQGWHSNSSNNSRITPTQAGTYRISGLVEFAANATGVRSVGLWLNGSSVGATLIAQTSTAAFATYTCPLHIASEYAFNGSTDWVELQAWQSSGGTLATATTIGSHLTVSWIGA